MAKTFDAASKHLIEAHPADWLALAGLPITGKVSVVDADVSTISAAADKVILVDGPEPYIAHFELQSAVDITVDGRVLWYNVLLRRRHGLPVRSVVILLRPEAQSASIVGRVYDSSWPDNYLDFRFKIIRVWEQSPQALLSGGLGTLPLAPISAVAANELPEVVRQMEARFEKESPREQHDLETASYIMLGLRYPKEMIAILLTGVRKMKESVTYQAILEEGEARGKVIGKTEGKRDTLVELGAKKFGPPDEETLKKISGVTDLNLLNTMLERLFEASSWEELVSFR
ncbi:MAG TPA: hypothetical protein VFE47_29945 [Tepidisphaeraceae bacterium]|nr:hypothetical protein [Tepidisphaeraceae bacterium]